MNKKLIAIGVVSMFLLTSVTLVSAVKMKTEIENSKTCGDKELPRVSSLSNGNTFYVAKTGNNVFGDGSLEKPWRTINHAIDKVSNGDTIHVDPGVYYENIEIDKLITLEGENKDTTIIDGQDKGHVVQISVEEVIVSGFTIRNGETYLGFMLVGSEASHNLIKGCNIHNNYAGVYITDCASYNVIENCKIYDNAYDGVWVQADWMDTSGETSPVGSIIKNCEIFGNRNGIHLGVSSEDGGILRGNKLYNNRYDLSIGGEFRYWDTPFIYDIDTSNTVNGKPIYYWVDHHDEQIPADAGFVGLISCSNILVKDIEISSNGRGVLLYKTSDCTIDNCIFGNCRTGIWLVLSPNNIIKNCVSALNRNFGIYLYDSNENTIYHNNFINNKNAKDNCNNQWDDDNEGNYWSDYKEQGIVDDDGDGIGDTSYLIPGGENEDRFPLIEPYGGNLRPIKPVISGPLNGKPGQEYEYTASTIDPNGDKLYYLFDWEDGTDSGWIATSKASHTWRETGTYRTRVKAKDEHGAESDWSYPLNVSMPKNKAINRPILNFLEKYPILSRLLELFPNTFPILKFSKL